MKSSHILGLLVFAGAFGAVAGGFAGSLGAGTRETGPDTLVADRLTEIARGVDALRDAASEARNDIADVQERLVAVELELARRATTPSRVTAAPTTEPAPAATPDMDPEDMRRALTRRAADMKARMGDMEAAAAAAAQTQERFARGMKIRAMPEDERWEYAADTLGLNSVQVDELRAAHTELQEGLKEAIEEESSETDGRSVTFRRVDGNKMRAAQDAFQARVDNALNDEQKKAWVDEGFGHALGRSRGAMWVSPRRLRSVDVDTDSSGPGSATIEIVTTTETREEGGKSD